MEYETFAELDTQSTWYQSMCSLHDRIFQSNGSDAIKGELSARPKYLVCVALHEGRVIGYKIGYQDRARRFYSWLGGVDPAYRKRGIGAGLMHRQHGWCKEHGYEVIRTHTKNKWRSMLILNLRHGFDVIGMYTDKRGEPKIILEKRL